jgi:serine/threonine protein kinase
MGPASYSSWRLIDMKNPAQHADLVRWMIFLLGPVERVTPAWQPRSDMRISRRSGSKVVEETVHWEPNGRHPLNSAWNGVRDVRHEPISKRTTVWARFITEPNDSWGISVLCKASWMSTGRQQFAHELEILRLLQDPLSQHVFPEIEDKGVFRRTDLMREIPQWQEVASNLPKPYGLVDLSEEPDYIVRPNIGATKPLERNQDQSEPRDTVALSALLLESRPANPLAVIQDLSMKQFLRIYIDVAKALWYLACEGIHHRDVTHDNIMARLVEEPGQSPRYAGVLIDFGSAIYSGERRDVDPVRSTDAYIKAGIDDGFAGSTFMISIAAHKHRCYDRTRDLRTIEECTNADGTIVVPEGSADKRWREKVVSYARKRLVQDRLHRFIDDLESLLYCMCSQVSSLRADWVSSALRTFPLVAP